MLRNATNLLTKWNARKNRKPLIVWGARQVGKTYLVKDIFAEEYYSNSYIYIDFKIEDEIRDFCDHTANAEKIIEYISLYKGKDINKNTLLSTFLSTSFAPTRTFFISPFAPLRTFSVL